MSQIPKSIPDLIEQLSAGGDWAVGEIIISKTWALRHRDDAEISPSALELHTWPEEAREIAKYDTSGAYRSLKTAPNLKRGWILQLESASETRTALDYFYPAAMGTYLAALRGELSPISLRETLGRQSGMYQIAQLTQDDQAAALILSMCNSESGCLRQLLWDMAPGRPQPLTESITPVWPQQEIPLLCVEACHLFISACRPLGKANALTSTPITRS